MKKKEKQRCNLKGKTKEKEEEEEEEEEDPKKEDILKKGLLGKQKRKTPSQITDFVSLQENSNQNDNTKPPVASIPTP